MKNIYFLFPAIALLFSTAAKAGGDITNKQLAGNWKITDVKFTNLDNAEKKVTNDNCYLCDLYKAKLGLIFTENGKVDYSNYGNPVNVRYVINGNVLSFFSETGNTAQADNSAEFVVSLTNDVLILTRIFPDFTETYTFTK